VHAWKRICVLFRQNPGLVHVDLPYDSCMGPNGSSMGLLPVTFILDTVSSRKHT
jgi:hypothetical protein